MRDDPRAPAAAYNLVADIVGDGFFLRVPPDAGTRLTVTGPDGVVTQWDMADFEAHVVAGKLRDLGRGVRVVTSKYRVAPSR